MRIALVTDGIWPYTIGGMQRHSYYLCKYLARTGVNVDLYYTLKNKTGNHNLADNFTADEISFITPYLIDCPAGPYFPGHYLWKSYTYSQSVYNQLNKNVESYDVIYIQGFSGWYLLKMKERNKKFPPVVLNFHGLEMFQASASFKSRLDQYLFRPFTTMQLRKADYVQSLGGKLTSILLSRGIKKDDIVEWPNGIERQWLVDHENKIKGPRKFVFIGRYERRKGLQELNAALSKVLAEGLEFEMHFIGPIPQEAQINDHKIHYHGLVKNDRVMQDVLDKMDCLILPSYAEGMPTVILEAMARGCSVIASDVGAVKEQVSTDNGYLVQPGKVSSLYEAIKKTISIEDSKLQHKKNTSLKIISKRYLWENISVTMIEGFRQMAKISNSESVV